MEVSVDIPYPCQWVYEESSGYSWHPSASMRNGAQQLDTRTLTKNKKLDGWKPPLPYARNIVRGMVYGPYVGFFSTGPLYPSYMGTYRESGTTVANCSGYMYSTAPPVPDHLVAQAELSARLKLKNQKVNLSEAFAEHAQTVELFSTTARRVASIVHACRTGNISNETLRDLRRAGGLSKNKFNAMRASKTPSQLFLELQYGWKPLMSDLYGTIDALHSNDYADPGRYVVDVVSSKRHKYQESYTATHTEPGFGIHIPVTRLRDVDQGATVHLSFMLENPVAASLSSLGITNPLVVAWELVPWSFVADWFLPIGNYLSALDATLGYTFKGGSVTRFTKVHGHYSLGHATDDHGAPMSCFINDGDFMQLSMVRSVYDSVPMPSIRALFTPDGLRGQRIANAVALVTQALKS